jgi:hypothetical protein
MIIKQESGLEIREYSRRDQSRWLRGNLYPQKLALTSPKSGGRSVGIVRLRTQTTEFFIKQEWANVSESLYCPHISKLFM